MAVSARMFEEGKNSVDSANDGTFPRVTASNIQSPGEPWSHEGSKLMIETTMRGSRLGAVSYENDTHLSLAERQMVRYDCPQGHHTVIPFSVEAEDIPLTWTCRCGQEAEVVTRAPNLAVPDERPERHVRTHWDMLLERRTIADLEELLNERLALLHSSELEQRKSA